MRCRICYNLPKATGNQKGRLHVPGFIVQGLGITVLEQAVCDSMLVWGGYIRAFGYYQDR